MPKDQRCPKFSSHVRTELTKFVLPGVFLFLFLVSLPGAITGGGLGIWLFAGVFLVSFVAIFVWSRWVKIVTLDGDCLLISNFKTTISVPISHLCRVEADRWNRTPNIILHFSPPTAFGSCVRFIPPKKFLNSDDFERIVAFLFDAVVANGYHPTALPVQRIKKQPQ